MSETILVRVDASLIPVLHSIKADVVSKMKKIYKLDDWTEEFNSAASKILAAHYTKTTSIKFKIAKNKGQRGEIIFDEETFKPLGDAEV